jgi:hypothetical protein
MGRGLASSRAKDRIAALLLLALGAGVAWAGHAYGVGTLTRMGAGYFPLLLGVSTLGVGLLLGLGTLVPAPDPAPRDAQPGRRHGIDLRGAGMVLLSLAAFLVLGRYGGMVPATFSCVLLAALADRANSLRTALLLAVAISLLGYLVFGLGLQLQFNAFQWG